MKATEPGTSGLLVREKEWARKLAAFILAWLTFETISGLSIYFLPFSVTNQWMVLVHTLVGLVVLLPFLYEQVRHIVVHWNHPLTALKVMGYLASGATLIAIVSGGVLTVQAGFATRISYGWDTAHVLSTFALIAFTVPHIVIILFRDRQTGSTLAAVQRRAVVRTAFGVVALSAVVAACWVAYPGDKWNNEFPEGYSMPLGKDRPFAPSLAKTETGGAYDPRSLSGSQSCGTSGCHEEIVAEWSVSAHRWASMDPGFQAIQSAMAKQNGPESTRYCGGCHDPISLFSGTKNIFAENLTSLQGYQEGIGCLVCHSVRKTDLEGNANYFLGQPDRYLFEIKEGAPAQFARDFLIRSYPRHHVTELSKRVFKTPEYCAACHKQFIDQEVNKVGWVQLQNQYDNWRKSRWNHPGDPKTTIECRECHMPLTASTDPASGDSSDYNRTADDGKHRSHRFIASNQFIPAVLKLPGADKQIELTEQWLKGTFEIPEIADKWMKGPVVTIELLAPEQIAPGEPMTIKAVLSSNKVGHDFPTGPLDIIQAWVEISATDETGKVVFESGGMNDRHFIQPGAFMFKAEPVDQYGNLIDKHNLWEMVGVRYRRSLFPGFSDTAEYSFRCPGGSDNIQEPTEGSREFHFDAPAGVKGSIHVSARLMYRKIDQYLLNFMFGDDTKLTTHITEMARSEAVVSITPVSAPAKAANAARVALATPAGALAGGAR